MHTGACWTGWHEPPDSIEPNAPATTTHGRCPAPGVLIVSMPYLRPKFSTHRDKLGFALKQQSVGNMEEDVGKENSQVQGKYQEP